MTNENIANATDGAPEHPGTSADTEVAGSPTRMRDQPAAGDAAASDVDARRAELLQFFEPLFAGSGGIDSWLRPPTPPEVIDRVAAVSTSPLGHAELSQLLILSHEAGMSEGFFSYYWLKAPGAHSYEVSRVEGFEPAWLEATKIVSLAHLKWGVTRFYVDALLYFGNIRSAYRSLRDKSFEQLEAFFYSHRFDTDYMRRRDDNLPMLPIAKDDRYLVAEMACKSLDASDGVSVLAEAMTHAYRAHVASGGSSVVLVEELLTGEFIKTKYEGREVQLAFSADDILSEAISSEDELREATAPVEAKFQKAREAALENTRRYLSMVENLDVYVATSMRTRDHFRRMATFCEDVFGAAPLSDLNLRYFDPTLSAADGHVDKGLIECLMVDAAKVLVYYAGDRESMGKDFEAAMALSRGKPVIFYCEDAGRENLYRSIHPLTRLIEFDTGVAIGVMVANSVDQVCLLLQRIFSNTMEYDIEKTIQGALHLLERTTRSLVRLQTGDRLLQETFWNYYHRRGALP